MKNTEDGEINMNQNKCFICGQIVAIINCHYNCHNCGFASNWDEGQVIDQFDLFKERENNNDTIKEISQSRNNTETETRTAI